MSSLSILERLRDPELMAAMSLGERLWGAVVVMIVGIVVCMIALTAILYSIKLMHLLFREKAAPAAAAAGAAAPPLPEAPADAAIVLSPAAGRVTLVNAGEGAAVLPGDVLLLLEVGGNVCQVVAPGAGTVLSLCVQAEEAVQADAPLLIFREKEEC